MFGCHFIKPVDKPIITAEHVAKAVVIIENTVTGINILIKPMDTVNKTDNVMSVM